MPDEGVDLDELDAGLLAGAVGGFLEQAQFDAIGSLTEEGEVGAVSVERGP